MYDDLIETVLEPGRPMSVEQLAAALTPRLPASERHRRLPFVKFALLNRALRANPGRYVEVTAGVWMRREGGPEAGAPGRLPLRPLAGSAAAEAAPPEPPTSLDAVGGAGGRAATPTS